MNRRQAKRKIEAAVKLVETAEKYLCEVGQAMDESKAVSDSRYEIGVSSLFSIQIYLKVLHKEV